MSINHKGLYYCTDVYVINRARDLDKTTVTATYEEYDGFEVMKVTAQNGDLRPVMWRHELRDMGAVRTD